MALIFFAAHRLPVSDSEVVTVNIHMHILFSQFSGSASVL